MHFEYGLDARYGGVAGAIVYDQRTSEQPVGADSNPHTVTATVTGLLPNAAYHARAVATNPTGSTLGSDQVFQTRADLPPPAPILGKQANFTPISGIVFVKPPHGATIAALEEPDATVAFVKGQGFIPLTEARQLPVGTQIDARRGTLRVASATPMSHGKPQVANLGGALFGVTQSARGLATPRRRGPRRPAPRCCRRSTPATATGNSVRGAATALPPFAALSGSPRTAATGRSRSSSGARCQYSTPSLARP
jgi:hypothetical protein